MLKSDSSTYHRILLNTVFIGVSMLVLTVFLPVLAYSFGMEWGYLSYLAFSDLCHQQVDRSFHLNGISLAVCARCLGIYIGIWLGMIWAFLTKSNQTGLMKYLPQLLLLFVLLNILQAGIEYATGFLSANSFRFAVGMLPGGALSAYITKSTLYDHKARIIHQAPMHRGHEQGKEKIMSKTYIDTLRK